MLATRALSLAHGKETILRDVSLTFHPSEVTALIGPNGAGKSTLLRALFGLHPPQAGTLVMEDRALSDWRLADWQARIGYMPQDNGVHGSLTALETILLGSLEELSLRLSESVLRRAAESLDRFGLLALSERRLETLSGGQRQLVYFAQAMMRAPKILLLDEPVSALDLRHQRILLRHVRETTKAGTLITVAVLHDLNLAIAYADRVVLMDEGRIVADGTPAEVLTPANLADVYGIEVSTYPTPGGFALHVHDAFGDI